MTKTDPLADHRGRNGRLDGEAYGRTNACSRIRSIAGCLRSYVALGEIGKRIPPSRTVP